jgi:mono/diheme cytochrome c family protein
MVSLPFLLSTPGSQLSLHLRPRPHIQTLRRQPCPQKSVTLQMILPMLRSTLLFSSLLFFVLACGKTDNQQGHNLYDKHCASCHFEEGTGLRSLMPPLAGSDYLRDNPREVVRGIHLGMKGPIIVNGKTYDEVMPGNTELSEFQIVNIVNYINQAWGNDYPTITVPDARIWMAE